MKLPWEKKKTMTMTKIPSRKPSGTYGHGPLKIGFCKGTDDDHDQDFLKKDLLHIWSWSSDKSSSSLVIRDEPLDQGRKRNPNPNFWVRISSGGVGVFHVKGWGAKKLDMCLETQEIKLFWRDIPGFCRDIPEAPEKFE